MTVRRYSLVGKIAIGTGVDWRQCIGEKSMGTVVLVVPGGIVCGGENHSKFFAWEDVSGWTFLSEAGYDRIEAAEEKRERERPARQAEMAKLWKAPKDD